MKSAIKKVCKLLTFFGIYIPEMQKNIHSEYRISIFNQQPLCHFCLSEKYFWLNINRNCTWLMFDIKHQPKLYISGLCLISNVNQNSIWLMFDIIHQPGLCWLTIDIHIVYVFFAFQGK